jgi:hypothetical protein
MKNGEQKMKRQDADVSITFLKPHAAKKRSISTGEPYESAFICQAPTFIPCCVFTILSLIHTASKKM